MREAVEHIEHEIENLRAIITELRPAALDELGLRTAIEALLDRHREQSGFEIDSELELPGPSSRKRASSDDLETTVYRLVQEALTNVAKHARADQVRVAVSESDGELLVEVQDDGAGFDPDAREPRLRAGRHARAGRTRRRHAERRLRRAGHAYQGCLPTPPGQAGLPVRCRAGRVLTHSGRVRRAW